MWLWLIVAALSSGMVHADFAHARECCARHGGIGHCDEKAGLYRCKDGYLSQCPCKPVAPFRWQGRLIRVQDCRSLELDRDGRANPVRLYGIRCPDRNEEIAQMGLRFVREFAEAKVLNVEPVGIDRQGKESAWVLADGENLNLALVRKGLAYWDRTQAPTHQDLNQAETEAKEKRLGIWSETPRRQAPDL